MSDALRPPESASPPPLPSPAGASATPGATAIVVAVVVVAALYYGREVLIPITLAMLLSFVLSPLVELLRRAWLGHILSVILAVVLALGVILALGSAIGTQVAQLAKDLPRYQTVIGEKITNLRDVTVGRLSSGIASLGQQVVGPAPANTPRPAPPPPGAESQAPQQKPIPVIVTNTAPSALEIGEQVVSPVLQPLATAGIILVVTFFTLLQKEDLRDRAIRLFGARDLQRTTVAMNDAARRLTRYFLTQLGINTSFGVIVAIGLYVIGVPSPVLWGILGALLRFIPYIGSWIAAALPIALAAAVEPGWSMAVWTAVLYVATELTLGQLVEPLVYGHSTGLSPVAVIVAAIFWTWIWGPIGLIISTPLTLCLVVLGRYVERLEFLDVLLGDRPALTPAESFYQRMLAGDPDEAAEQAEAYLKDRPLVSYYDEVALAGLRLADNDLARGTLAPSKVERLKASVAELIHDLGQHGDRPPVAADAKKADAEPTADRLPAEDAPHEEKKKALVLCIAGRGPLDDAASSMLAQLLGKHGLDARVVAHDAVSRKHIATLDTREVAVACILYLDISGSPAHLRYLLRRLRERLPGATLLVGLWRAQDPIMSDRDLRRAVGADDYVSTLGEAVEACLAAAHQAAESKPATVAADA
jgi:predicted PurR-regulated permease PerM